jgi:hypothetical protein
MKKTNLIIAIVTASLLVGSVAVNKAKALWIIPVFSAPTVIAEITTIISEIEEAAAVIDSVTSQLQIDEAIRGLSKSSVLKMATSAADQIRSGGSFAGDMLGEFKGVEAVMNYVADKEAQLTELNKKATEYLLSSYQGMEDLIYVQGEVVSLNSLGAEWSKNNSLISVAENVEGYLESNPDIASIMGLGADAEITSNFFASNKEVLHDLSDVYLQEMENVIDAAKDYLALKGKIDPPICLTSKDDIIECQIEMTVDGQETDSYDGKRSRLTEMQAVVAVANSITSVSSNKCKNIATNMTGVSSLYLNEQDYPTTADAIEAVDGAVKNAARCMQEVIATTIDDLPGASADSSYFGTDIVAKLEQYGDLIGYDPASLNDRLSDLDDIIANTRILQYSTDKMAAIAEKGIENVVSDFFDSLTNSEVVSNMVQTAYNKGVGANLGLQGMGSLSHKVSDLSGVKEITGELESIFKGIKKDVAPDDAAKMLYGYLFEDKKFESFTGKTYEYNEAKYDYCPANVCDKTKISSARQIIVNELLSYANKHHLAETLTAYSVADDSLADRMKGLTNMATTTEGVQDSMMALYMAKKELLRSIRANNYLAADSLYLESLSLSAAIVTGKGAGV